jgi:hypothetical protein
MTDHSRLSSWGRSVAGPHSRNEVAPAESTPACHDARTLRQARRRSDACLARLLTMRGQAATSSRRRCDTGAAEMTPIYHTQQRELRRARLTSAVASPASRPTGG